MYIFLPTIRFYKIQSVFVLINIQCRLKGVPFIFMTSHLESMAALSELRRIQLGSCFRRMKRESANYTVIFGGDMNLKDWEVLK